VDQTKDSVVMIKSYDQYKLYLSHASLSSYNNSNDGSNDESHSTVRDRIFSTTKTTISSSHSSKNNRLDSSAAAMMRILLYKLNTVSDADTMFKLNVDTISPAIMMKSYDTVYNLYFDTTLDTAFNNITLYGTCTIILRLRRLEILRRDNGSIDSATTVRRTYTVAVKAPSAIPMTTQVYSLSSSSPSELSNKSVIFSAVANAVTSTTTSYMSPSSTNTNNNPLSLNNNGVTSDTSYQLVYRMTTVVTTRVFIIQVQYCVQCTNNRSSLLFLSLFYVHILLITGVSCI